VVGRAEQRSACGDVEGDVALQHDGRGEKCATGKLDGAASGFGAGIDRGLNGLGVFGGTVGLGSVGSSIADFACSHCGKSRGHDHGRLGYCCQPNSQAVHLVSRSVPETPFAS
jgi:hypothetical protein